MSLSSNFPTVGPVLNLDFVNNQALDPRVTFTRASTATYFDYAGVLQTAQNDIPRFDYNPSTFVPQGLLIEEARTNSIRNNTMQGAAAGTPGTLPTNWSVFAASGLTTTVVATGISNGVSYIDLRFSGTSTNTFYVFAFDNSAVVASAGQSWTESFWVSLISGSLANINSCNINIRWSTGTSDIPFTPTTTFTRISGTAVAPASITNVIPALFINMPNGAAIDITLRIGLPQMELGAFATSVIPTSTVAVTRSADVASMTGANFSSWYNQSEGTIYTQAIGVNNIAGATRRFVEISDNTANERFIVGYSGTTATRLLVTDGGATQADITVTTGVQAGLLVKMAAAYKVNDFQQASNNTLGTADTSGTLPTVNRMFIGQDSTPVGAATLNGYIQRIAYYNYRVSNAQLQALTGS